MHSEFRDGNVPAGHQQLRVLIEALGRLPAGVEKVMLRSATRGTSGSCCGTCEEGGRAVRGDRVCGWGRRDDGVPPCGVRGRRARLDQTLYRKVGEHRVDTGQQWA